MFQCLSLKFFLFDLVTVAHTHPVAGWWAVLGCRGPWGLSIFLWVPTASLHTLSPGCCWYLKFTLSCFSAIKCNPLELKQITVYKFIIQWGRKLVLETSLCKQNYFHYLKMHSYNLSLKYVLLLLLTDGGAREVGFLAGSSATGRLMKPSLVWILVGQFIFWASVFPFLKQVQ